VRVYQFRHIRAVEPIVASLERFLAPRAVVRLAGRREVGKVSLDAGREFLVHGRARYDGEPLLPPAALPRLPALEAEARREVRPLGGSDQHDGEREEHDREEVHRLILEDLKRSDSNPITPTCSPVGPSA
jgi:hypothetical protein